jgi:SAM-dependent methyltransferase
LRRAWIEAHSDAEMHVRGFQGLQGQLRSLGVADLGHRQILDLGCGGGAQLALLFSDSDARVTAVDMRPVALGMRRPRMWVASLAEEGPRSAIRLIARDAIHTFRYWHSLRRIAGRPLRPGGVRLVRADAAGLPFPDGQFDLVVSSAVWEHLPDVQRATAEVARVLSPTGIAYIQIALFPALQGGHHPDWHSTEPGIDRTTRPWDHLRANARPFPTYLNEWRESQYRQVIEHELDVVEWADGEMRGAEYLTPELESELSAYTRRELLVSGVSVWAKKRGSDAAQGH